MSTTRLRSAPHLEHAAEEALELALPRRGFLESPRQRRRRLELERDLVSRDRDALRLGLGIEIESRLHRRGGQLSMAVLELQQRRCRDLHRRRNEIAQRLLLGGASRFAGRRTLRAPGQHEGSQLHVSPTASHDGGAKQWRTRAVPAAPAGLRCAGLGA
jgi:hypothetical protein